MRLRSLLGLFPGGCSVCQRLWDAISLLASKALWGAFCQAGTRCRHTEPRERARSTLHHSHGPALADDIPSPCFLLCLNKHRICRALGGGGGRERKAPETAVPAIHPAPSCPMAPNCLFIKGPVCKLVSQYKRAEHACCLKIHPSKLRR